MIPQEIVNMGPQAIGIYENAIKNGTSPRMAEMFASRKAPGGGITTDVFMADSPALHLRDQFDGDEWRLSRVINGAKRAGFTPNATDRYIPTVARFEGDPRAFINHKHTLGDLKRELEDAGVEAEGAVNTSGRNAPPAKPQLTRLAPQIVERIRKRMVKENPDLAHSDQKQLRQEIVEKHGSETVNAH